MRSLCAWMLAAAASAVVSCGGGMTASNLFSTGWTDDGGASIEAVRRRIGDAPIRRNIDLALGVVQRGGLLIGRPLEGAGAPWTFACNFDGRPTIAGDLALASCDGNLVALEGKTGKVVWKRPTGGLPMRGAGDDGRVTVITFAGIKGTGSMVLAIRRDGSVLRRIETDKEVGIPAVVNGVAFLPWSEQYVSAVDIVAGGEIGRVVLREKTTRAWVTGGRLYFGELGAFRFDTRIASASKGGASHVSPKARDLPPGPHLFLPGTQKLPTAANGLDKAQIFARPADKNGTFVFEGDHTLATYFRLVFALPQGDAPVTWVRRWDADFIGGDTGNGILALCDETGRVSYFDSTSGVDRGSAQLGRAVDACVVQVDAFAPPPATQGGAPLLEQLVSGIVPGDPEADRAQRFLLGELVRIDDPGVTRALVRLASDPRTPPALVADARRYIASRKTGPEPLLQALELQYDYLEDVQAPGVGPLAHALGAMGEKRAAAPLLKHLLDPQTLPEDLRAVAEALVTLATPAQAAGLRAYVALNRTTAELEDERAALYYAAQALANVGSDDDRAFIAFAAKDPFTQPRMRGRLDLVKAPK